MPIHRRWEEVRLEGITLDGPDEVPRLTLRSSEGGESHRYALSYHEAELVVRECEGLRDPVPGLIDHFSHWLGRRGRILSFRLDPDGEGGILMFRRNGRSRRLHLPLGEGILLALRHGARLEIPARRDHRSERSEISAETLPPPDKTSRDSWAPAGGSDA